MLFGYPTAATRENWLHECLAEIVTTIHARMDRNLDPLGWPRLIPRARRSILQSRSGLMRRLDAYRIALGKLNTGERARVLQCMREQNDVEGLLSCGSNCQQIIELPESVQEVVGDLFGYAFALLTELGIRDRNYRAIYDEDEYHVCPFCGCEYFDAPVTPAPRTGSAERQIREDSDHYLARSLYPFAAANLRNLSPMGGRCNTYKLQRDVLRNDAGVRRRAFYPYADRTVSISLLNSVPFAGADGVTPKWQIEFQPDSPECVTWDDLFSLKSRLRRDVLDTSFQRWLRDFAVWFRAEYGAPKVTHARITAALDKYAENEAIKGLNGRDFLRALVFRMLHRHCTSRNSRLLNFIKSVITESVPPRPPKAAPSP